jgi:hypothetical protein
MPEEKASAEQLAHRPVTHPALTTPCTVLQLHNWLKSVSGVTSGDHWESNVTTTASSISVA